LSKIFLITGGTGSFGSTMVKHLLKDNDNEVRVLSRDEKKQDDLRSLHSNKNLKMFLGDVRDKDSVLAAMKDVDFVFHAAALKQVPSCEFFPMEAIKTNVLGTENVCKAAIACGVKKFVCLSTDKAVYPINAMGISKAMMEKVVLSHSRHPYNNHDTTFCITRYGNVMGSRGSVIPLFFEQTRQSNPLTITNGKMTRFMMSLEQSVDLVMFAFKEGASGDICVQKAESAYISTLAEAVRKIASSDIPVRYIGTRHAEKVHEVLLSSEEYLTAKDMGNFFIVGIDGRDLNYIDYESKGSKEKQPAPYSSENATILDKQTLISKILELGLDKKE